MIKIYKYNEKTKEFERVKKLKSISNDTNTNIPNKQLKK